MFSPHEKSGVTLRDRADMLNWQKSTPWLAWKGRRVGNAPRDDLQLRTRACRRVAHAVDRCTARAKSLRL